MTEPPAPAAPSNSNITRNSNSNINNKVYTSHFKNQKDQELIRLALRNSPFFSCLDDEQVERLVDTAQLKTYRRGDIVILEGCVDDDDDDDDNELLTQVTDQSTATDEATAINGAAGYEIDTSYDDPAEADADELNDEEEEDVAAREESSSQPNQSDAVAATPASPDASEQESLPLDDSLDSIKPLSPSDKDKILDGTREVVVHDVRNPPALHMSSTSPTLVAEKEQTSPQEAQPPPPRSGIPRCIYIIRKGLAGIWFQPNFNPASLGPGTLFGEGGFLFGRQHSASVVAADDTLECWVVDHDTFRNHVLPSTNVQLCFQSHAQHQDEISGEPYMTMDDFVQAVTELQNEGNGLQSSVWDDSMVSLRIANTYNILRRKNAGANALIPSAGDPRIQLSDFAFFQFLMARPDPEIDIAFLLMDEKQTGQIYLNDLAKFLQPAFPDLDLTSQFFKRYFGKEGQNYSIRPTHFSQFLADLQQFE